MQKLQKLQLGRRTTKSQMHENWQLLSAGYLPLPLEGVWVVGVVERMVGLIDEGEVCSGAERIFK